MIGTVGTVSSGAYVDADRRAPACRSTSRSAACPGFVEFVERGQTVGDEVMVLAERLLAPICDADVDALLLGCTHYPFLARTISDVMGPQRHARQLGRRDRLRRARSPRRRSVCCATAGHAAGTSPLRVEWRRRHVPRARRPPARPRTRSHRTLAGHVTDRRHRHPHHPTLEVTMPRPDGRAADELRPITFERDLHRDGRRVVLVTFGQHPRAVHGVDRRRRAALDARHGQGMGHRRVLDAARARRPSGSIARRRRASRAAAPSRSSA